MPGKRKPSSKDPPASKKPKTGAQKGGSKGRKPKPQSQPQPSARAGTSTDPDLGDTVTYPASPSKWKQNLPRNHGKPQA